MRQYTVGTYTLGCKVSQYETEAIEESFIKHGFGVLPFNEPCDVYVINTCTVTAESDRKSRQIIRRAIGKNKNAVVIAVGCYAQRAKEELIKIEGVDAVIGTSDKLLCVDIAKSILSGADRGICHVGDLDGAKFEPMCIERAPRTRAYVKIEDGCECKCTYCAIAPARGRVRSKPKNDVISEVEGLYKNGTREIVLTGIETGSYGKDFDEDYTLASLICELNERGSCDRLRLGSLAPELVGESFVLKVKDCEILAPHFHLSLQSGSDRVLRRMKRRYNRRTALENIERIRKYIPNAQFTTDLMVGFPGESEEDFLDTVEFVKQARFIDAHVFAYSRREGTEAAAYDDQIAESVKKERSRRLIECKQTVKTEVLLEIAARTEPLRVVAELRSADGIYTSHSDEFAEVHFSAPDGLTGAYLYVMPREVKDGVIIGDYIGEI